jgi:hypothetical protein
MHVTQKTLYFNVGGKHLIHFPDNIARQTQHEYAGSTGQSHCQYEHRNEPGFDAVEHTVPEFTHDHYSGSSCSTAIPLSVELQPGVAILPPPAPCCSHIHR